MDGPLSGIRVLEVGHLMAGPYATMMLADLGAEVIKIEPPGGDPSRAVGEAYFASVNRNKRSVCLDLNDEAGRLRLGELAASAHALLANLKPSAIHRFGLTYDKLKRWNEHIVCFAITGVGLERGDDPAFDYLVQAATGAVALNSEHEDEPTLSGYPSAGNSAGLTAALGLLAQIHSGRGGQFEATLRDVMLSELNYRASIYLNEGTELGRMPGLFPSSVPAQFFPTAEGHLALFITTDAHWKTFAAEAGIEGFATNADRTERREELLAIVTEALSASTARAWEAALRPLGVPAAAVRTVPEALAAAPEAIVQAGEFKLIGSPVRGGGYEPEYRPPPRLGEYDEQG